MRNRGIEIFLLPEEEQSLADDVESVLAAVGVPGVALPRAMAAAHRAVALHAEQAHRLVFFS